MVGPLRHQRLNPQMPYRLARSSRAPLPHPAILPIIVAGGLLAGDGPARASDVDSEHLFGFSEGADIGKTGEREIESETVLRQGKAGGRYGTVTENLEAKQVVADGLRLNARATFSYFGISGVPGLPDRGEAALHGVTFEARYVLIDRARAPVGLTLIADTRWGRVDDTSGEAVRSHGALLALAMDREFIPGKLFGALNWLYDADATHFDATGLSTHQSKAGVAAALAGHVRGGLYLGAELRYLRVYDGLGLNTYAGQALFAGPTMYLQLAPQWALSGGWNWQIRGHTAASGGPLDLTHFERQLVKLRLNHNF
jgi:hypothetical protein